MNCVDQSYASLVWAIVGVVVLAIIFYTIISSKIAEAKRKSLHQIKMTTVEREYMSGQIFDVWTKHGTKFERVKLLRESREMYGETGLAIGDNLIFQKEDGLQLTVRKQAVRIMECVAIAG
jgi:hypothetical protein